MIRNVAILCLLALAGCASHSGLPDLGGVPAFTLTAQDGASFSSDALKGKVWVADFIFTTCSGPCPRMSSRMRRLQDQLLRRGVPDDVRLVSVTVDPGHDTAPVLLDYASHFRANPKLWHFLTGPEESIRKLSVDTFHVNTVAAPLEHSSRLILIDGKARIRGYYETTDATMLATLMGDIDKLRKEGL
jgi:protein SCO1/2